MRGGLAVVVLAACGRIGFDGTSDAASADASPDASSVCVPVSLNDEDNDGLTDDCDPCPHVRGDGADADGDGVGDACDPRSTPTEAIALFDPFLAETSAWSYGTTRVEAGYLAMDGGQLSTAQLLETPQRSVYSIRAWMFSFGTAQHQFTFQLRSSGTQRLFCELYTNPPDFYTSATYTLDGTQFTTASTMLPGAFVDGEGTDIVMEMVFDPPQFTCRLEWLGTVYTTPTATMPPTLDPTDIRIVMNGMAGGVLHFTRISME